MAAVNNNVERKCAYSRDEAKQGESEESFVNTAYHDADVVVPVVDIADMCKGAATPPAEQGETDRPWYQQYRVQE